MAEPLIELPAARIAVRLGETFDGLGCSFNDVAPGRAPVVELYPLHENLSGYRGQIEEWSIERAAEEHPLLRYYLGTGLRIPVRTHDVPDTFADPRFCGEWTALARACDCQEQMALPLRLQPGVHRAFVLGRGQPFTDAELDLGRVLWRVLTGLDRQVSAFARARRDMGPAGHDVASAIRLTPREAAVLGLLSEGLTAGAIGRRLAIAERTVHKHLERCYTKLGVADRLSAVLRAQRLGLVGAAS
jgi:DNA-binding CsgD family transcriptional regulator